MLTFLHLPLPNTAYVIMFTLLNNVLSFPVTERVESLATMRSWEIPLGECVIHTEVCLLSFGGLSIDIRGAGESLKQCIPGKVSSIEDEYQ